MAATPADTTYLSQLSRALPPRQEAVLERRWEFWLPWVSLSAPAAQLGVPGLTADFIERMRQRHRSAAILCIAAGLPWATVRRYALDDPRRVDADRDRKIAIATERRRSRLGRVKGVINRRKKERQNANRT
jgi:hypothetical protein